MSQIAIQAIETSYSEVKFRSRTEARWAVFFDHCQIEWQYEIEGYDTPYGSYLPDFYLPSLKTWVEVKAKTGEEHDSDSAKLEFVASARNERGLLMRGCPHEIPGLADELSLPATVAIAAMKASKSARFEHNESPIPQIILSEADKIPLDQIPKTLVWDEHNRMETAVRIIDVIVPYLASFNMVLIPGEGICRVGKKKAPASVDAIKMAIQSCVRLYGKTCTRVDYGRYEVVKLSDKHVTRDHAAAVKELCISYQGKPEKSHFSILSRSVDSSVNSLIARSQDLPPAKDLRRALLKSTLAGPLTAKFSTQIVPSMSREQIDGLIVSNRPEGNSHKGFPAWLPLMELMRRDVFGGMTISWENFSMNRWNFDDFIQAYRRRLVAGSAQLYIIDLVHRIDVLCHELESLLRVLHSGLPCTAVKTRQGTSLFWRASTCLTRDAAETWETRMVEFLSLCGFEAKVGTFQPLDDDYELIYGESL